MQFEKAKIVIGTRFLSRFFVVTVLASYIYVFMEWVFFVTKPSFFDTLDLWRKLSTLFLTGLIVSILSLGILLILFFLTQFISLVIPYKKITYLGAIVPSIILNALLLLLVDNFTYTIFKFGVVTTVGIWRGFYAALFVVTFMLIFRWLLKEFIFNVRKYKTSDKILLGISISLIIISSVTILLSHPSLKDSSSTLQVKQLEKSPNIILLGADGVNALNMSAYGYERETTPNISALTKKSLFMENAFTNAGNSAGSVMAIFTGKNATETRVLYPPDILRGIDSFQHLPGILHQLGYYTAELGTQHYVDAYNMNLLDGFDEVNGKKIQKSHLTKLLEPFGYDVAYFSSKLNERVSDRLLHIFYLKNMENAYQNVFDAETKNYEDNEKIERLFELLSESEKPIFVHIHMMGTHGPKFYPRERVFSAEENQDDPWMTDFYDDSILDYDTYVGQVIEQLSVMGKLSNTIIVIYTDHNMEYATNQKIPLIIYFPDEQYAGKIQTNSQNIDIAPTLLAYLKIPVPGWMEGVSLLGKESGYERLIFSTAALAAKSSNGFFVLDEEKSKAPFFQFGYLGIINCQNWYRYTFNTGIWHSGSIVGHTYKCDNQDLLTPNEIKDALLDHLKSKGFDISSLQGTITLPPPVISIP